MIINQMLLAVKLLFVALVMEITRRIVTGDHPTTFFYGNFLWMLLFASAQSPFLSQSLRKTYKLFALTIGVVAGILFDSLIGPLLLLVIFYLIKGTPVDSMGIFFGAIYAVKIVAIVIAFAVSKAVVKKFVGVTASGNSKPPAR